MGIYGPRTVYCIALAECAGCHEFLLMDDGKWLHVKETTEIGESWQRPPAAALRLLLAHGPGCRWPGRVSGCVWVAHPHAIGAHCTPTAAHLMTPDRRLGSADTAPAPRLLPAWLLPSR